MKTFFKIAELLVSIQNSQFRTSTVLRKLTSGKPSVFNHLIDLNPCRPPALRFADRGHFHSSWCRPSRGGIVSANYFATQFVLFSMASKKQGSQTLDSTLT